MLTASWGPFRGVSFAGLSRLGEPIGRFYPEFVAEAGGRDPGEAGRPIKIVLLEQRPSAVDDQVGNGQIEGDEIVASGTDGGQRRHGVALLFGIRLVPDLGGRWRFASFGQEDP